MKVICIDADPTNGTLDCRPTFSEGDILEAVDGGDNLYKIVGHTTCSCGVPGALWYKERFIPLSEIDETELVNEKLQTA